MTEREGSTGFQRELRAKYDSYFEIADDLISMARQMAEGRPLLFFSEFDGLAAFFFTKSYKTFAAIVVLAENGFGEDAAVLSRGLVENATNLFYIKEDPELRANLYLEYEYVARNRYVEVLEQAGAFEKAEVRPQAVASRDELRRLYESVKKNYPNENLWSGKSLRAMAEEVGLASHYRYAYKYFSDIAHAGPSIINQFLKPGEQAGLIGIMFGPDETFITEALIWSCDLFWRVLTANNEIFTLDFDGALHDIAGRMHEAFGGPVDIDAG